MSLTQHRQPVEVGFAREKGEVDAEYEGPQQLAQQINATQH